MQGSSQYPSFFSVPPALKHQKHSPPAVFLFAHILLLMPFCITIVSFSFPPLHLVASLPRSPPPPICCLHSFSFSLVPFPLLLSSLSHFLPFPFLYFLSFSPHPISYALLSYASSSTLRWESHNASEAVRERRGGGGGGVPILHSIHTSTGEDMWEHCNDGGEVGPLFVTYSVGGKRKK